MPENTRPIQIENADGGIVSASISGPEAHLPGVFFGFEHHDDPRLRRLREEYDLDAVLAGAPDEMEKILGLRHWVHTRWPIDDYTPFPYEDALDILEAAKKGGGFYCAHSQVVANAVFSAYGFPTRMLYVDVDYRRRPKGGHHAVNEVWCNDLCKWIVIDCKYDIHFERDGVPLSALEVHQAVRRDGGRGIVKRLGLERTDPAGDEKWHGNIGSYFWVGYFLRSDCFTQPHWYLNNDCSTRLVVLETPQVRETSWPRYEVSKNLIYEPDPHQIDWTPNVPRLFTIKQAAPGRLRLRVLSATPNFRQYRVRLDGKEWRTMDYDGGWMDWSLHAGTNTFDVRARNLWDMDGPAVTLTVVTKD